jgi:hypothetical protein
MNSDHLILKFRLIRSKGNSVSFKIIHPLELENVEKWHMNMMEIDIN